MNTKHLLVASSFIALAGCTTLGIQDTHRVAKSVPVALACPPNCTVKIAVADGCAVRYADPAVLHVRAKTNRPITFEIVGAEKYKLVQGSGINFGSAKNSWWSGTPPFSGNQPGGRSVALNVRNESSRDEGAWHYDINVTDGTNNCSLDPTVVNDDGTVSYP